MIISPIFQKTLKFGPLKCVYLKSFVWLGNYFNFIEIFKNWNVVSRAVFLNFDDGDIDNPTGARASTAAQHNASVKASVTSPATASTTEMSLKVIFSPWFSEVLATEKKIALGKAIGGHSIYRRFSCRLPCKS